MSSLEDADTYYALSTGRTPYYQRDLDQYERNKVAGRTSEVAEPKNANLISSETSRGVHRPVIDCDYPITAIPSSTPGHFHLYIDKDLTWEQYVALLDGMYKAGLIEAGWYKNALTDERTYVRLPNVHKPKPVKGTPPVYAY